MCGCYVVGSVSSEKGAREREREALKEEGKDWEHKMAEMHGTS